MTLLVDNVNLSRGGRDVLSRVSARIEPTRMVGVVGPNGAGKSTLLAALAGHLPYQGRITWRDRPIGPEVLGYMPQAGQVRAAISVLETVLLGRHAQLRWRVRGADIDRAEAALAAFGLETLASRAMNTLSGGQQQMVLLAQRLAKDPRILVLDEATSALDLRHQLLVMDHVRRFARTHEAVVVIALHDLNLAIRHVDELLLVAPGGTVSHGPPVQLITRETLRRVYGIEAEVHPGAGDRPVIVPMALSGEVSGGGDVTPTPVFPGAVS